MIMGDSTSVEQVLPVKTPPLGKAARQSLIWSGAFTIFRDVAQFVTMIFLVRIVSPADFGAAALAQTALGFLSILSFGNILTHALQLRDPSQVDWQAHFTAGILVNGAVCLLTETLAATLWFIPKYHAAAVPVAFLATVFIVEVVGSLRQRMVQVAHDWRRYRVLVGAGSLLALGVGLMVGLAGGGIWALVVQPPLFGVPAAVDLFVIKKWRPDWSWSWVRYRETAIFGANRIGAGALYNGRLVIEQGRIAGVFDLTTLGMFTRSLGLATLVSGRVGAVAVEALYPVLTRAEARSAHFQRMADLVLRGVCWLTIAAGVYLAINADDIVALLYGSRWRPVASLLPTSVAVVATGGISSAVSSLLLANNNVRESLLLSFLASGTAIALALVLVPFGTTIYLGALASQGVLMVVLSLSFLLLSRGATIWGVAAALGPAAITAFLSVSSVVLLRSIGAGGNGLLLRLLVSGLVLGVSHLIVMRGFFSRLLGELLDVAPFGSILARSLVLRSAAVSIAL